MDYTFKNCSEARSSVTCCYHNTIKSERIKKNIETSSRVRWGGDWAGQWRMIFILLFLRQASFLKWIVQVPVGWSEQAQSACFSELSWEGDLGYHLPISTDFPLVSTPTAVPLCLADSLVFVSLYSFQRHLAFPGWLPYYGQRSGDHSAKSVSTLASASQLLKCGLSSS